MAAPLPLPPYNIPVIDPNTGAMTEEWRRYYLALQTALGTGAAPNDARFVVTTSNPALTNEVNLGALSSGYLKQTVALGVATLAAVASIPLTDVQNLSSGTYTPTLTGVSNVDAVTAFAAQYSRVGAVVTVSGKLEVNTTTGGLSTEVGISIPVASDFTAGEQCGGAANAGSAVQAGAITADSVNNRAALIFIAAGTTNLAMSFTFSYQVL